MSRAPCGLSAEVAADWTALARPTDALAGFDVAAADELPEAARRWITHAIAAGTPLADALDAPGAR